MRLIREVKKGWLVTLLFFIGVILYFYKLGDIPAGFYVDEATTGYNAYSLLKTGKDEYGKVFPVALRFFGSYSPPLYTYLTIPVISLFGLNTFAVRFVSAASGVLMVLLVYFFAKSLRIFKVGFSIFITVLLFAISPWSLIISRAGYEIYLAFLLFSAGAFLLWKALNTPKFLVAGFLVLSLSTYAAHSQRFLFPIFVAVYLFLFKEKLLSKSYRKTLYQGLVISFITQIPNLYLLTTPAFFTKGSLFFGERVMAQATKIVTVLPIIISVPLSFLREYFSQYSSYFSPRSLFLLGDPVFQRSAPELGVFYSWMIIPYFTGIYYLYKERKKAQYKYLIFLALLSPSLASFSGDPFSSQRALALLLPLSLIIGIGVDRIISKVRKSVWTPVMFALVLFSLLMLWRSYFIFLPRERAIYWSYGYEKLAEEIKRHPNDNFIIDQARQKPAYIELLFFLGFPPRELHKAVGGSIKDNYYYDTKFNSSYKIANFETRDIVWEEDIYSDNILVGDSLAISDGQVKEHLLTEVFEIRDPLDRVIFQGFKTNPKQKCFSINQANVYCK